MKQLAAGLLLSLAATFPALATGSIACRSEAGASVDLTIGFTITSAVIGVSMTAGGTDWSTHATDAVPIVIAQSFFQDDKILLDIADQNLETIVARLRLFVATEGYEQAMAGTLQITDVGVYAVSCLGP